MQKNKKIIIEIGIVFLLFGVYFFVSNNSPHPVSIKIEPAPLLNKERGLRGEVVTLKINGVQYQSKIQNQTSVYDFMAKLKEEGKIDFTEKNYTGMGKFITSINGLEGNGTENWIYYINGKQAETGVSNNIINPGDVVSWKYEKGY